MQHHPLPIIRPFCGAGGLDWSFRLERFRVILACDNPIAAIHNYKLKTRAAALLNVAKKHQHEAPPCQ